MKQARMILVSLLLCLLVAASHCFGMPTSGVTGGGTEVTVLDIGGTPYATGITGLDNSGTSYDVQFRVGSAASIWSDITTATYFGDIPGAQTAAGAVVGALNIPPVYQQLADPSGSLASFPDWFVIPTSTLSGFPDIIIGEPGHYSDPSWVAGPPQIPASSGDYNWAVFSLASTGPLPPPEVVPAPSALLLAATGVLSVFGSRRLRARRHSS